MRYFFEISYHGGKYNGWQSQANARGVQAVVEESLSTLLRDKIEIVGSGRTDTGVHCKQQFFHVDIDTQFEQQNFLVRINSFLPSDISINTIRQVRPDAHARYDAYERSYTYHITRQKNPFADGLAWYFFKSLDVKTMNEAASLLLGMHDYECFSKVHTDVNHFHCDIKRAAWLEDGNRLEFNITANRFLRGMVRAIVGTLIDVGTGKTSIEEFQQIIQGKDRRKAGANVPPYGLYLVSVKYQDDIFLKQ